MAVVVTGVALAVPLLSGGSRPTASGVAGTAGTTKAAPATASPREFARPASLPGAADQALWDTLEGTGVVWDGCAYTESATTSVSYLTCDTTAPPLDRTLGFESHASAEEVRVEIDGYTRLLTGNPGTCDSGGKSSGMLLGREVTCGFFTLDDGTVVYFIVWTRPGRILLNWN